MAIVFVNFKTYQQGKDSLKLAKEIEKIDKKVIIGVSPVDIKEISDKTKLIVYSEHVDACEPGRNTGFILPEAIKAAGAKGTFLNHSEHKLNLEVIAKTIDRCKKIKLATAVFVESLEEAKKVEKMNPDYIIYEPIELVGGNISVSNAKPEVIKNISKNLKKDFLVGAGIKTNKDIKKSIELGAIGVTVSSVITTAKNPRKVLKELLS